MLKRFIDDAMMVLWIIVVWCLVGVAYAELVLR